MKTKNYKILDNLNLIRNIHLKWYKPEGELIADNPKNFVFDIASSNEVYEHLFKTGYLSSLMMHMGVYVESTVSFENLN